MLTFSDIQHLFVYDDELSGTLNGDPGCHSNQYYQLYTIRNKHIRFVFTTNLLMMLYFSNKTNQIGLAKHFHKNDPTDLVIPQCQLFRTVRCDGTCLIGKLTNPTMKLQFLSTGFD